MKITILFPALLSAIIFLAPTFLFAQTIGDPEGVPIDGGVSLLIAAGVAYGVKKALPKRRKTEKSLLPGDNL